MPKRVVFETPPLYRISKSEELGNEVQVGNRLEETSDISKIRVYVYLFKEGLRQPILIFLVFCIGPIEDQLIAFPDFFVGEESLSVTPRFLPQSKCIAP